jgi:hypothetical protein
MSFTRSPSALRDKADRKYNSLASGIWDQSRVESRIEAEGPRREQVTENPVFKASLRKPSGIRAWQPRVFSRLIETGASMKTLAICLLVLCAAMTARLSAQATDCNDPHASPEANAIAQQQWENGSSPVYGDATALAHTLNERGFGVQCIRRSKGERFFQGQKGAAWFKTDRGIFEVWFLPKPENFAGLEIDEHRENGEYVYTFRGTPHISTTIESSKPNYFIESENVLFNVLADEQLAASIRNAFQKP